MENEPLNASMNTEESEQTASGNGKYIVMAVVVIAVLALAYFYSAPTPVADVQPSAVENSEVMPLGESNTIEDIQADLDQTPDASAELDQDAAASAQEVQSL